LNRTFGIHCSGKADHRVFRCLDGSRPTVEQLLALDNVGEHGPSGQFGGSLFGTAAIEGLHNQRVKTAQSFRQKRERLRDLGPFQLGVDRRGRKHLELERIEVGVAVLAQAVAARLWQLDRQAHEVPSNCE
jgi:hypothetical protein